MNHRVKAGAIRAATTTVLTVFSAVTACAPAKVEPTQSYQGAQSAQGAQGAPLPRPEIIVVRDFTATPDAVTLDNGVGARVRNAVAGTSESARQTDDDRKVTTTISRVLVEEIRKLGFLTVQSDEMIARTGMRKLVVGGQILSIDEGNRTRRNVIGLGAGRSEVQAHAEIYYYTDAADAHLMESFTAEAESNRKPGAAETMGAGAAAGRVAESAAVGAGTGLALSGDVEADGARMAKAIAKHLGQFFAEQGWIPAPAH